MHTPTCRALPTLVWALALTLQALLCQVVRAHDSPLPSATLVQRDGGHFTLSLRWDAARALQLTLDWDPTLSWHQSLLDADAAQTPYALRATLPNSTVLYYGVYVGFDGEPAMTINENIKTVASFSLASPHTRY